jgi:hypothetical protein
MQNPETTRPYLSKLEGSAARFFTTQFFSPSYNDTRQQILTRLWGVISNSVLERMFANKRNKVNLFEAMNKGSLILIHTAKDLLKQEGCEILGRFFIALIAQAAQERAALPKEQRLPTFVYIDEAHDYFDESIEHLLEQVRKFRVGLVLSHQHTGQLKELRATVMANTAVKLVGGLSYDDAREFAKNMGPNCTPEFLLGMRKHADDKKPYTEFACYIRNIEGLMSAIALPVPLLTMERQPKMPAAKRASLIEENRARYGATNGKPPDNPPPDDSPLGDPELL